MNGVFKFKENLFLKYKKEISLTVGAVLTLATVVKFVPVDGSNVPSDIIDKAGVSDAPEVIEEIIETNGYKVMLDGLELGILNTTNDGQEAINEAMAMVVAELGYNPEVIPDLTYEDNYSLEKIYLNIDALAEDLKDHIIANLDSVKIKAFVMKIGDDFTVAMSCEDDIEQVLENAQSIYINSDDMILDINLAKDNHNSLVMIPTVTMVKEDEATLATRAFKGNDGNEGADGLEPEKPEKEKDVRLDGETVAVDFAENVMVVETYVYEEEVKDVETATELITKENDKPKMYKIASGDVPSIIAESNDMTTTELYNLNPGLKENARRMQIGDEVIVMVPEPELSVATREQVSYTETIYRGTTYVNNPDKYKGSESTVDNGSNGVMSITAIVSKVNGDETKREIIDKTISVAPKDRVISRGSKPLPPKGATGNYSSPLTEYRVTSRFGYRWGGFHYGIDLAAPSGTPVQAADGGVVTIAGWYGNYGYLVEINHGGGVRTRYGHNSKILVSVGQQVSQYEQIAKVGNTGRSTGPHVHFEIRFDGICANPMNYISFK